MKLDRILSYEEILSSVDPVAMEIFSRRKGAALDSALSSEELRQLQVVAERVRQTLATDQILKRTLFSALWDYLTYLDEDGIFGQAVRATSFLLSCGGNEMSQWLR